MLKFDEHKICAYAITRFLFVYCVHIEIQDQPTHDALDAWDVSNLLLKNSFCALFWLKCIKCRQILSIMDEDFHFIIPVALLYRTMEIYYMSILKLKFKEHPFCDYRDPCDILSCFLKRFVFLIFPKI